MKITIVQGAFLPVPAVMGGAVEKVWDALGKEFAKRGHHVTHLSRQHCDLPTKELAQGVRHTRIRGFDAPGSLFLLKALDLLYSMRVLRLLPAADILITNTFWLPIIARRPSRGQTYVHVGRYPKGQMRFYRNAARLQTVSTAVAEAIGHEAPRLKSRIRVIPYPMIPPSLNVAIPNGMVREKELLYVGRIHPEKGLDLLLAAAALIPVEKLGSWRIVIVGPSELRHGGGGDGYLNHLKTISGAIANRVHWAGPIFDPAELAKIYRRASLFVYPSLAEMGETFGLAPLEAMAQGCPPMVSDLHCFRDYLHAGVNGFTFNHRATHPASDLARSIENCLSDADQLERVGKNAQLTAQNYSLQRIASAYLEDFESVMNENAIVGRHHGA